MLSQPYWSYFSGFPAHGKPASFILVPLLIVGPFAFDELALDSAPVASRSAGPLIIGSNCIYIVVFHEVLKDFDLIDVEKFLIRSYWTLIIDDSLLLALLYR